jgi:hypothetical protein
MESCHVDGFMIARKSEEVGEKKDVGCGEMVESLARLRLAHMDLRLHLTINKVAHTTFHCS